jgi:hypothetical protein
MNNGALVVKILINGGKNMYYYKVVSSHWPTQMEFASDIKLEIDQCFRILSHNGSRHYPTRLKVVDISDQPEYRGSIVKILAVDKEVDKF